MMKQILISAVLSLLIFQGTALALETEGEIIFRDALYGAAIGAILGGAFYLADQDDAGTKFGIGVAAGTIGGLIFGVMETRSFVAIEDGTVRFAVPTPVMEKKGEALQYSASLLKTRF